MKRQLLMLTTLTILIASLLVVPSSAVGQEDSPVAVLQQIYDAVTADNIDAAMELVADDVVAVFMPPPPDHDGIITGKEEMRAWFEKVRDNPTYAGVKFSEIQTNDNKATWTATWYTDDFKSIGLDTIEFEGSNIVQNGLLKQHTWIFTEDFLARLTAANQLAANETLVQRYMEELWNQNDLSVAEELIAEDFVSHNFPEGDREALIESVVDFRAGAPNGYFTYDDMTVTDDRVFIVTQLMIRPDGAAADADGEPASDPMVLIMGVEDGQISSRQLFMAAPAEIPAPTEQAYAVTALVHSQCSPYVDATNFYNYGAKNRLEELIVTKDTIVMRGTVLMPDENGELQESLEAAIFLSVENGQITERRIAIFGLEPPLPTE